MHVAPPEGCSLTGPAPVSTGNILLVVGPGGGGAVLSGDIVLDDIDTDLYQVITNQTPVRKREEIERKQREARARQAVGLS